MGLERERDDAVPDDRAAVLLALHHGPGFVIPNAWDAGSARILAQVGFPAIATTSAGIAWSCGVPDGGALDLDTMLEHIARIVAAVDVPVSADLEAGYGDTPDEVGRTVARAVALGVAGGNIEDTFGGRLFDIDEAADRIAAARAAASAGTFVLNARTDAPTLFSLGVARVSLGGSLARTALSGLERAGRELLETGTLGFLDGAITYADLQRRFGA
ncbi:hypothetical protein ASD65_10270 [Microbacterium sp. Root61]|uniref:isocitrate lyase/PEP mutase family protein n=1 Tax=Microbacterium sp. Root61 TaxID=1736570 RepID=UPI0006F66EA0|nr:isocitrate lyase/phosphoenolpyruvate mutase family protein [Microbacterium sp. Root61]KRA24763.1 hypothetical protein ASD65_10270 [Microbacterium sp. Root61]